MFAARVQLRVYSSSMAERIAEAKGSGRKEHQHESDAPW